MSVFLSLVRFLLEPIEYALAIISPCLKEGDLTKYVPRSSRCHSKGEGGLAGRLVVATLVACSLAGATEVATTNSSRPAVS